MGNKNTPEIRFPGFIGDWEQRRLNEYLTTSKVKNRDERFGKEDVLSVSGDFGIVNQIEFQGRSFAGVSVAPYGVVETGDVVYTKSPLKSNPFGIIKTNKGQAGIVSTLYAVYKPNDNVDSKFVERYFENDQRLNRYLKPLVNKGAKNDMKVSDDNALIGTVVFPVKVDEQRKISSFFNQLDNLITLQQQELDTLKQTKQGFLQKMFPKEGETVPEIRFPGFSGEWEDRKLSEIAEFNPKSILPDEFEYVDLESVVGTNLIAHRTESKESAPSRAQRLAQRGDVFYQTVRPYQKNNYLYDLPYNNYVFSTGYAQMRPIIDSYFLLSRVQEELFVKTVLDRSTGTSYPAINSNDLSEIEIKVPTDNDEQTQIGNFFKQLDETIALQQKELDALKQTKKAFLQKMFI
ncbi:restriction endonuclease subunit S [Cytobacillus kochii]|uniref:restriction endonuclease subunit S n=1 Tax=Cytobacillus kochii TaxID=859143 RepID=UPI002E23A465|nr:restriction endonuclease subunit S [Cytobacillus kochii]